MIEHDWTVGSSIAQFAFRKLTFLASPNVRSTLTLQELTAINRGVCQDVFHLAASIALKDVFVFRICGDHTSGTLSIEASPCCMSQIFWNEVTLRPCQLLIFCGATRPCTSVEYRLVYGMATLGRLFSGAQLAADVAGGARDLPFLLHVFREL